MTSGRLLATAIESCVRMAMAENRLTARVHQIQGNIGKNASSHVVTLWPEVASFVMDAKPSSKYSCRRSSFGFIQPGVFCPSLLEDRDIRVGILPKREEIPIGVFGLGHLARDRVRSAQLQACQCPYWVE